jgi:hypothetical protein
MCIPERWFTRDGTFFTRAWKMETRMIEGVLCWVVPPRLFMVRLSSSRKIFDTNYPQVFLKMKKPFYHLSSHGSTLTLFSVTVGEP